MPSFHSFEVGFGHGINDDRLVSRVGFHSFEVGFGQWGSNNSAIQNNPVFIPSR